MPAVEATMTPERPILRMRSISKAFSGHRVLDSVDFDLRRGEVHILAGENGAGKTTLIKILTGVHTDYEGSIELDGAPVRFRRPQDAAGRGISVIHQELSLVPSMSVADNIFLGRERCRFGSWVDSHSQQASCERLLDRLELDLDLNRPVEGYPLSVQQTIEIAGALAFDARVIVMDEPTSALAEPEVERLFGLIADLRQSGCAIVYITHRMEEIYRIGDRITVLRDGNLVGTAPVSELPRDELVRWMVGRELGEQFPRHAAHLGRERLRVEHFTLPDPEGLRRPVVQDVSFIARAGEILGLAGLYGSGASELLAGLFGVYGGLAHGSVWLDGEPFQPGSPSRAIGQGMALLTNDRKTTGLVLGMSIANNVTLASIPKYSPGTWLQQGRELRTAERHQATFGLRAAGLDLPVETLSGGNQQKVVLAKWLETEPRVLLLDEPTRGVDVGAKRDIYQLMDRWTSEGYAIVLITSEMPELLAMSDRIIVMHRGQVTAEFSRGEATQEAVLHAAMGRKEATVGAH